MFGRDCFSACKTLTGYTVLLLLSTYRNNCYYNVTARRVRSAAVRVHDVLDIVTLNHTWPEVAFINQ